ncbi:MAG: sulfite exporter TauE/SafE family protein [Planctomycetota bacterium]|jgi:uncharacterized membrane protein YfcA
MVELSAAKIAALVVSALIVGISKAGFGSGVGMMAVPLMAVAIGSDRMLGVLLPVLIVGDVFSIIHYIRARDGRNLLVLLAGCAGGIACGALVLGWFRGLPDGARLLDGSVGGLCILFVAAQTWLLVRRVRAEVERTPAAEVEGSVPAAAADPSGTAADPTTPLPYRPAAWHGVLAGLAAGLTSTLAHAAGPVVAIFLLAQRMDKRVFVGTSAWFFLGCNLMKVPVFLAGERPIISVDTLSYLPYLAPLVIIGTFLGVWMNRRIPAWAFSAVVYVLVFLTGAKLVWGALA